MWSWPRISLLFPPMPSNRCLYLANTVFISCTPSIEVTVFFQIAQQIWLVFHVPQLVKRYFQYSAALLKNSSSELVDSATLVSCSSGHEHSQICTQKKTGSSCGTCGISFHTQDSLSLSWGLQSIHRNHFCVAYQFCISEKIHFLLVWGLAARTPHEIRKCSDVSPSFIRLGFRLSLSLVR